MNSEDQKSLAAQPDVCRCCLSTSGTWDLTVAYLSDSGIKEVYADMLTECFGISLSHIHEWGTSKLLCETCVENLRGAVKFKICVQNADKIFAEYCNRRGNYELKVETKEMVGFTNNVNTEGDHLKYAITSTNSVRERHKTKLKGKRETEEIHETSSYDSAIPISKIIPEQPNSEVQPMNNQSTKRQRKPYPRDTKQISQRKRVILTCGIILRDTSACPFRHHKSWFQCFFCSEEFMDMTSLRDHTLENHADIETELKTMKRYPRSLQIDISNLKCRDCSLNLSDVNTMQRHFETVHNKIIYNECIADYKVNSSPYLCHLCDKEFHVFRTLSSHLNEHYANCICDVCGRSFINSKRLKVHKRIHENGQFPCSLCDKVLKTKMSRANHIESAHCKRAIKCQICSKPMKHYNDRIKHMSEAHNITHKFKCPICSREYNIKHYLATHIRQTHGNKNKICSECGMVFITNHGLKKHMLKHSGEKPYSCGICSKAYARSYTLREHMRAHEINLLTKNP